MFKAEELIEIAKRVTGNDHVVGWSIEKKAQVILEVESYTEGLPNKGEEWSPKLDGTEREKAQALDVINYLINRTSDFTRLSRIDDGDGAEYSVWFSHDEISHEMVASERDLLTAALRALLESTT